MNRIVPPGMFLDPNFREVHDAHLRGSAPGQRNVPAVVPAQEFPLEVRPLRGLPDNKRGNSIPLFVGQEFTTVVEARTPQAEVSEMLTLCVGIEQNGSTTTAQDGDLVGRVVWGIAGAHFQSDIDIYRGLTLSLPANYLRFDVRYPTPVIVPAPAISYIVSAGIAYGSMFGRQSPPRLTQGPLDLTAVGGGADFVDLLIPRWAVSFTIDAIVANPAVQPNLRILVTNASTSRAAAFEYVSNRNNSNQFETMIPYFNGRERMRIINLDAANAVTVNVIHTLSF